MVSLSGSPRARKYAERYAQGVILRDNDLSTYSNFLRNMGESHSLLELVGGILRQKGRCRILDVGCGNGNALHELVQHAGVRVHTMGIDLLPLEHPSFVQEFVQGDVHEVPIPGDCDLILSFRALHEMGNLATLIPRLADALAPGGRAYLWVRMRDPGNGGPSFVGEMNAHEEKSLMGLPHAPLPHGGKIFLEPVHQTLPGGDSHTSSFVAGYVVLLHRPSRK